MQEQGLNIHRIFNILPHNDVFGGIKSANMLVNLLRDQGIDAFIATPDGGSAQWLVKPAPTLTWEAVRRQVEARDILIFNWMPKVAQWPEAGVSIIHARDHFQEFRGTHRSRYQYWAVSSSVEQRLMQLGIMGKIWRVPSYVDTSIFRPCPKLAGSVAYMPRRGYNIIADVVRRRSDIVWIPIADKSEGEVAELLGKADLFLYPTIGIERDGVSASLSSNVFAVFHRMAQRWRMRVDAAGTLTHPHYSPEGFGLPGLEAMASGAVLVCFEFGAPYLATGNHLTVTTKTIESTIDLVLSDLVLTQATRAAAFETARHWDAAHTWKLLCSALTECIESMPRSYG